MLVSRSRVETSVFVQIYVLEFLTNFNSELYFHNEYFDDQRAVDNDNDCVKIENKGTCNKNKLCECNQGFVPDGDKCGNY